jgi:membrane-bound serine protease (ClpP class)
MIGEAGRALTSIEPGGVGRVQAHGELWTATATEPIAAGQSVTVTAVTGLLLTVRPDTRIPVPTGGLH